MVDYDTTYITYKSQPYGSPEECGCSDCQNYIKHREHIYPIEVKQLFSDLGIDSVKVE